MTAITKKYQLWVYYEKSDKWVLDGFFYEYRDARERFQKLYEGLETPCMPDWEIVEVEVIGP